jgi:hypothetical protein
MPKKGTTKPDDLMKARYRKMRVNGKQVNVCRYVMEQKLGRQLEPGEYVHHINGNKLDDRPENLEVVTAKAHATIHLLGKSLPDDVRQKISKANTGKKFPNRKSSTPEGNQKRSETMKKIRKERFWSTRRNHESMAVPHAGAAEPG